LNGVIMAHTGRLGVFMGDNLVEPVSQAVTLPSFADYRPVLSGHQIGVE